MLKIFGLGVDPSPSSTLKDIANNQYPGLKVHIGRRPMALLRCNLRSNIATTLSLDKWKGDESEEATRQTEEGVGVNFICMHPDIEQNAARDPGSSPDISVAARYQEIFVDLVAMKTALETAR